MWRAEIRKGERISLESGVGLAEAFKYAASKRRREVRLTNSSLCQTPGSLASASLQRCVTELGKFIRIRVSQHLAAGRQARFLPAPIEELLVAIGQSKPDLVFTPHVETSSGIMLDENYIRSGGEQAYPVPRSPLFREQNSKTDAWTNLIPETL
jgi:hypothetical protein